MYFTHKYVLDENSAIVETENGRKRTCHRHHGRKDLGREEDTTYGMYLSVIIISHRGSNALPYHKIKGYVMSLCGKEPPRRNFL